MKAKFSINCCNEMEDILDNPTIFWARILQGDNFVYCMPYMQSQHEEHKIIRVNHCPNCGTYIGDIEMKYVK